MSILVIAEKPSVGMSLAAVLGAAERKDGYVEGGGYIVSWCVGHLVGLADATAYGDFGKWRREDLPIVPDTWQTVVAPDKRKQFDILKNLMERADTESLICATDAGREGELIFRFVYEKAGCKKPFKRLWISSLEDTAIRAGFGSLKDGSEYDSLYQSALCRARADWLVGINATRLFSTLYGKTLSVGRVQSPTLAMLTERQQRISGFKKERYHHVGLEMDGGFHARSERIADVKDAESMRAAADGKQAVCTKMTREQKTAAPPKLFDLTALQREANRLFGCTAKQTLDTAQSLYEKKLLTYPRTDSRYLTSDMEAGISALVDVAAEIIGSGGNFNVNAGQVVDDAKVSDHHAIVPTPSVARADTSALTEAERNILLLTCARLVCATGDRHVYEAIEAEFFCGGHIFKAKGKATLTEGWKAADALFKDTLKLKSDAEDSGGDDDGLPLPVTEGQTFENVAATVTEHFTAPPKPHTEATLLSAMEAAGAADTADDTERKGLGTPATRASVIENIVGRGFAERKGKQLVPTTDGEVLIKVLPDALKSPALTSEWENTLALIAKGEASPEGFIDDIVKLTETIVRESAKDDALACMFSPGKEIVGTCPRCGSNVFEGKKNFYCASRECSFAMWKNDRFFESKKKELTKTIAAALLKDGKVQVKGLYSEKSGKTYDAVILLADTGAKYVNYRFEKRK
jgi:DNA topoisomerase-3